jgi:hypothetical protein
MSAIHESTKFLVRQAFALFEEAVQNGKTERANDLRKSLLEVFDNTIDDNATLLEEVKVTISGEPIGQFDPEGEEA